MIGMLLTGVYAEDGGWATTGDPSLFIKHLLSMLMVVLFVGLSSFFILRFVDKLIPMRVSEQEEHEGLNRAVHGEAVFKRA